MSICIFAYYKLPTEPLVGGILYLHIRFLLPQENNPWDLLFEFGFSLSIYKVNPTPKNITICCLKQ